MVVRLNNDEVDLVVNEAAAFRKIGKEELITYLRERKRERE